VGTDRLGMEWCEGEWGGGAAIVVVAALVAAVRP
jgi:hypothetical protein